MDVLEVNGDLVVDHPAQGHVIKLPEEMQRASSYEMILHPPGVESTDDLGSRFSKSDGSHVDLLVFKANRKFAEKDFDMAIDLLYQALRLNPRQTRVYNMIGSVYFILRDEEMARKYWNESLQMNADQPEVKRFLEKLSPTSET